MSRSHLRKVEAEYVGGNLAAEVLKHPSDSRVPWGLRSKACSYHVSKDLHSLVWPPCLDAVSNNLPHSPQSKLEAFVCPLGLLLDLTAGSGQREVGSMSVEHASQEHPPELQPQPTTILLNFGSFTAQETFGNVQRHWTSLVVQMVKGFPCNSDGKESTCNVRDLGSIPGLGRSTGGEHGHPLHYFCLENLHGQRSLVGHSPWGRKDQTWLSD